MTRIAMPTITIVPTAHFTYDIKTSILNPLNKKGEARGV
jgi:hypothetical protein